MEVLSINLQDWIQLSGLILGLVGSMLLAINLTRIIKLLILSVKAHETSIESIVGKNDVYIFKGFGKQLNNAKKYNNSITAWGFWLLVISFILQISRCFI